MSECEEKRQQGKYPNQLMLGLEKKPVSATHLEVITRRKQLSQ